MELRKSSAIILVLIITVILTGVAGYSLIEGWSFQDSAYMTVITLTTTGFREVHKLSPEGRMFTMLLLMFGLGTVVYSTGHLMQDLLSINFKIRRRKKMETKIARLKDHAIICGFGRIGKTICKELAAHNVSFVVIDKDSELREGFTECQYNWMLGDAAHDEVLLKAGIEHAKTLVCMVDSDADSLYISLAGRSLNPKLRIVSRASEESARQKILRAGADKVVLPTVVSGQKVAHSVLNPAIDDLLDIAGVNLPESKRVQMAELTISDENDLIGRSLTNCGFKRNDLMVVGIRHNSGDFTFAPEADYAFKSGDTLITLSTPESFTHIKGTHGF